MPVLFDVICLYYSVMSILICFPFSFTAYLKSYHHSLSGMFTITTDLGVKVILHIRCYHHNRSRCQSNHGLSGISSPLPILIPAYLPICLFCIAAHLSITLINSSTYSCSAPLKSHLSTCPCPAPLKSKL